MLKRFQAFIFRLKVQAEIRAQTGDQIIVTKLCVNTEIIDVIKQSHSFLRSRSGYNGKVAAFITLFPVYARALASDAYTLEDKIKIASWLNDADAKAKRKFDFYTNYAQIFLPARSSMHEFCLRHNIALDS